VSSQKAQVLLLTTQRIVGDRKYPQSRPVAHLRAQHRDVVDVQVDHFEAGQLARVLRQWAVEEILGEVELGEQFKFTQRLCEARPRNTVKADTKYRSIAKVRRDQVTLAKSRTRTWNSSSPLNKLFFARLRLVRHCNFAVYVDMSGRRFIFMDVRARVSDCFSTTLFK
jgi:hypothetical protein